MLALFLFFLAGTVYGSIHAEYHRDAISRMPLHVMAVHGLVKQDHVQNQRMILQNTSTSCSDAWDALIDWGNSSICYTWLDSLWDLDASVDGIIEDYCSPDPDDDNKTCSDKIYDLLVTLVQECEGTDDYPWVKDSVRTIMFATKVPCIRDDEDPNVLCFKEFRYLGSPEFLSADLGDGTVNGTNTTTFNGTALDMLCSNCTYKVLEQISLFAPDQFWEFGAYIKIMCTQYSGEMCAIRFLGLAENASLEIDLTDGHIDSVCDPCVQTLVYRFSQYNGAMESSSDFALSVSVLGAYSIMCQQDNSGQYCMSELIDFLHARNQSYNTTNICLGVANGTELCPDTECQSFWHDLVEELGCCAGAWFDFMQFQYTVVPELYEYQQSPQELKIIFNESCGVEIPEACELSELLLNVTLSNIDAEWVAENQIPFLSLLSDAIVYALAMDPTSLNFGYMLGPQLFSTPQHLQRRLLSNDDGTFNVVVGVITKDRRQRSQVETNAENLDLTVLYTGLPAQAIVDPTKPVTVEKSTLTLLDTTPTIPSSSSSSSSSTTPTSSSTGGSPRSNSASTLTSSAVFLAAAIALLLAAF